jgi:uncharacterized surface protein with fasciclin (FAS1) repeats
LLLLLLHLQAAGVQFPDGASWTIFAPNNEAFAADDIKEDTGLTAEQLLAPEYKEKLAQVGGGHAGCAGQFWASCCLAL